MSEEQEQGVNVGMFDHLIKTADWISGERLPIALVLTEELEPAEGKDAVIFPPTFAKKESDLSEHPYCIDIFPRDMPNAQGEIEFNECLIDSVGAEGNYMEECFKEEKFSHLVPQHTIKAKGKTASLLDVGHRIADISVLSSKDFGDKAVAAMKALYEENNASELAELAPTSLIFGFWNSRGKKDVGEYKYKFGRILGSTITATNVALRSRRGLYIPAFDDGELGIDEYLVLKNVKKKENESFVDAFFKANNVKKKAADIGLANVPVPSNKDEKLPVIRKDGKTLGMHGGIRVFGKIIRRTQINLVNLRSLAVAENKKIKEEETKALRRYLLGLALVASRSRAGYFLREGCLLRQVSGDFQVVYAKGNPEPFAWNEKQCLDFATKVKEQFKVEEGKPAEFQLEKLLEYAQKTPVEEQS